MNSQYQDRQARSSENLIQEAVKDWHRRLPSFTIQEDSVLSRLIGPLLISVILEPQGATEVYRPQLGVHNLATPQEYIYITLGEYLIAERMKQQALLPLEGPVTISQIRKAYQDHAAQPDRFFTPELISDPILIAAWVGRQDLAEEALEWGYRELLKKPQQRLVWRTQAGKTILMEHPEDPDFRGKASTWRTNMQERIAHPEILREIVKQEIIKHKLTHIPQEELIPE